MEDTNREQSMAEREEKEHGRVHDRRNIGSKDPDHFSNYEIDPKTGMPDPDRPKSGKID